MDLKDLRIRKGISDNIFNVREFRIVIRGMTDNITKSTRRKRHWVLRGARVARGALSLGTFL